MEGSTTLWHQGNRFCHEISRRQLYQASGPVPRTITLYRRAVDIPPLGIELKNTACHFTMSWTAPNSDRVRCPEERCSMQDQDDY
jgi:hypothetical protein